MSGALVWLLVALGLGVVVVRRRSFAVGLVTVQALVLAVARRSDDRRRPRPQCSRSARVALGALLLLVVSRTREPRPVRAGIAPIARAGLAVGFALALTWLVPGDRPRLEERRARRARADRVRRRRPRRRGARRSSRCSGSCSCENGLALAALELPGGSSTAIELGVAFDLTLVALVAAVFHERIFAEFGAGDTAALRSLRD